MQSYQVKTIKKLYFIFFLFLFVECTNKPDYPDSPYLEYIGLSKSTLIQGDLNTDSIKIFLEFTDGDGDIGLDQNDSLQNLFIIDSRTGNFAERIKIPEIPNTGFGNGVSGEIELLLYTTCCLYEDNIPPCSIIDGIPTDTLTYKIYMLDRAGNTSDTVETDPIILRCE